ncbi:Ger(x)C family spore germination protein [Alicyclobacillus macrosporangiidus]|uniref:Ger(x)C family spore germination protein n=1 Tax=Alicyclobacillus macrosporangiidus TaxID=392015 RepID=UPI0004959F45|nr:Ger(x)C family spore germination protein [Alicyclobacillus macrosporangiidus]
MNPRVRVLAATLLTCLLITGCWDRVELKDLALVMATGIDTAGPDNPTAIRITTEVANPGGIVGGGGSQGGGGQGPGPQAFVTASGQGVNIKDAEQKLQEQFSRRLYTAHRRVVVFGEDVARRGIREMLDQLGRDPLNRLQVYILVAKGGPAQDILQERSTLERLPGQELSKLIEQGTGVKITMLDFLITAIDEGIDPIAGAVEIAPGNDPRVKQPFLLASTAMFKDFKLRGYLNDEETRGLLWVRGETHTGYITARVPEGNGMVSLFLSRMSTRLRPVIQGGRVVRMDVNLEGEGEVVENDSSLDLGIPKNMQVVDQACTQEVESYVQRAVQKAKENDCDIFGFGREVYRTNPRLWMRIRGQWDDIFRDLPVQVNASIHALRPGGATEPLHLNETVERDTH